MFPLKLQRGVFLGVALVFLPLNLLIPRLTPQLEIILTAALIVFLGVPHGALDMLYLRKVLRDRSRSGIAIALAGYVAVSAAVIALWMISPLVFLLCFLAASALHFTGDPEEGASVFTRISAGVGVVVLPTLIHGQEVQRLYAMLTTESVAKVVGLISMPVAFVVLLLGAVALGVECVARRGWNALELLVILLLATFEPPLLAFTIYFCLMHSARHILRTAEMVDVPRRAFVLECVLPMVGVLVTGAIAWRMSPAIPVDARVIQIVFVLLAALTAPHMIIVEPVRFRGWRLEKVPTKIPIP